MNKHGLAIVHTWLVFLCVAGAGDWAQGQENAPSPDNGDRLWSLVETQLEKNPADTSLNFIVLLVRGQCGADDSCLFASYTHVVELMERRFHLPGAIFVCEEMIRVAQKARRIKWEAIAHKNLARFHDAKGNSHKSTVNMDRAIDLFRKIGDQQEVFYGRIVQLDYSLGYRDPDEVFSDMLALLEEAKAADMQQSVNHIRLRLVYRLIEHQRFAELALQVDTLSRVPVDSPYAKFEYGLRVAVARGQAEVARASKLMEEARAHYQQALAYAEEEPNRWAQINILLSLASFEWEVPQKTAAKAHLQKALTLGESLELHDLLRDAYQLSARFAEDERRYADVVACIKKEAYHQKKLEERRAGFDQRSYYLALEKEQLATEKAKQQLELKLRRAQSISFMIGLILTLLLATGLLLAYLQTRKGKLALTEQNKLIRQQAARLENLDAAKSRFFANVSHELRTPLTLMLGPVGSLLKENNLTTKQTQLLHMALRSGKQLEQLVSEILDLGKLEMGKMELHAEPTRLSAFIRMYCVQFESLALRKEVQYTFHIDAGNTAVVLIDQAKYRQILYNLLSNAFKFTPKGGAIAVNISLREGNLTLAVSDTGPGIHPDDLPHLFDRNFQTSRPEKAAEGGTGIGLALCSEYARLMGGEIRVDSALGRGAVFQVRIPVISGSPADVVSLEEPNPYPETTTAGGLPAIDGPDDQQAMPHPAQTARPAGAQEGAPSRPSILIVEDNPELLAYIQLVLAGHCAIQTAENGLVAWNLLTSGSARVDLIISDIMMPVMDGYQLLEKLKSNHATRHLPVIMLTARADAQDKLRALRIGVDDYLLKPFDEEELLVRINNLMKNVKARQEETPEPAANHADAAAISARDREWLESWEQFVRDRLADDTLTVPGMAHAFAMSESTLLRQLKRLTGLSPQQYLMEMRLQEARTLLEMRAFGSVREVASRVGYHDAKAFSKSFKQRFGKLPTEL